MNLDSIEPSATILLDANILLYGVRNTSAQCGRLLRRCANREVTGVVGLIHVIEVVHRLMMFEAKEAGAIINGNPTRTLSQHPDRVRDLHKFADAIRSLFASALRFEEIVEEDIVFALHIIRQYGLLTIDACLVALAHRLHIPNVASADRAFARVEGMRLYVPDDIV